MGAAPALVDPVAVAPATLPCCWSASLVAYVLRIVALDLAFIAISLILGCGDNAALTFFLVRTDEKLVPERTLRHR